ncbi:hypothetical protein [Membranihabitans maritimus]|uniref:hypothetical protein n=1 Tax=Membranihabitans maritimus TaxID=2904244 RepID=UPI001F299ABE|nr:hypothetical protein [Membranihabitans maritimus]
MSTLLKLLSVLLMAGLFITITSCDKEDPIPEGPQVSITSPGLTVSNGLLEVGVTQDSMVIISYTVDAPGGIMTLEQSVEGVSESVSAAVGQDAYTRQIIVDVPYEDKEIPVEVNVTDDHGQSSSASLSIAVEAIVPPATPLTDNQLITMGGNSSPSEFSRWDFDIPVGYSGWALRNTDQDKVESIDIFYTNLSFRDNDDNGMFGEDGTGGVFLKTDFTEEEFRNMEDDALFSDMEIDKTYVDFEIGDVVIFETDMGRKGILFAKEYYEGTDDIDIEIKLQEN